ncbi:hypothetical protein B0H67DRAFT_303150 [Lasiosphaeris hirsuta]|uniref:Uncharacterized protein n=1 Tax=Lasiosphaeris hirsuta TaxID=260670 RepID=A0AA40DQL8_9PEZI|nr:hypothetical protein B0H67DRAFT_303150 [Lasiosphaeris hirsuta]
MAILTFCRGAPPKPVKLVRRWGPKLDPSLEGAGKKSYRLSYRAHLAMAAATLHFPSASPASRHPTVPIPPISPQATSLTHSPTLPSSASGARATCGFTVHRQYAQQSTPAHTLNRNCGGDFHGQLEPSGSGPGLGPSGFWWGHLVWSGKRPWRIEREGGSEFSQRSSPKARSDQSSRSWPGRWGSPSPQFPNPQEARDGASANRSPSATSWPPAIQSAIRPISILDASPIR